MEVQLARSWRTPLKGNLRAIARDGDLRALTLVDEGGGVVRRVAHVDGVAGAREALRKSLAAQGRKVRGEFPALDAISVDVSCADLTAPATYSVETDVSFPLEETVLPVAKRKLLRMAKVGVA